MADALGIDLGGTAIKWVTLSADLRITASGRIPTPHTRDEIIAAIDGIVRVTAPSTAGVGLPGHVDRETGVVRFLPNLPGDWSSRAITSHAITSYAIKKLAAFNDARAFAFAESRMGAARGETDALFLTLGTGVGGAILSGGRLLAGPDDRLGEIGHMIYDRAGPVCGCGARGCLETFASGPAIARNAGGGRTAAQVALDAEDGEPEALAALGLAGRAIGETVASLAAVIPCDALVVGGGVAGALALLRPHIEAALASRRDFIGPIRVLGAELGPEAGAIGAALMTIGNDKAEGNRG